MRANPLARPSPVLECVGATLSKHVAEVIHREHGRVARIAVSESRGALLTLVAETDCGELCRNLDAISSELENRGNIIPDALGSPVALFGRDHIADKLAALSLFVDDLSDHELSVRIDDADLAADDSPSKGRD